jgi:hypothetical protein
MDSKNNKENISGVQIVANEEGVIINVYNSNSKFGYIKLQSDELDKDTGQKRNCLLRAETALLEKFLQKFCSLASLPGRIVIHEFLETELPENFRSRIDKTKPWEEAIKPFIKRNSIIDYRMLSNVKELNKLNIIDENGSMLMSKDGKFILKFCDYDPTGNEKDARVNYENLSLFEYPPFPRVSFETISSISPVESLNVQNLSRIASEKIVSKTNVTPTLNVKTVTEPDFKSNFGQTNNYNSKHQSKSHTSSNVLFVIGLLTIVLFAFMFKNITIFVVGAAFVGFLSYLIGGIIQGPSKSSNFGSTILTIVIGIIGIIAISYAFGGCDFSEPDSGWRRP